MQVDQHSSSEIPVNNQELKNSKPGFDDDSKDFENRDGWFRRWFGACPTSLSLLREAENGILSYVKVPIKGRYVNIRPIVGQDELKIWTVSLTESNSGKTPLVLLHGLGSGVALWAYNLEALAKDRHVHALDVLGFASSSRPNFSSDPHEAEMQLVESIEEWRKEMNLERFNVLGHSMGAYLVTSYAIKYPKRISHLILADPWGFPETPTDPGKHFKRFPAWIRAFVYLTQSLNPLWAMRAFAFRGPRVIEKYRPDLVQKFTALGEDRRSQIADYIFQCNTRTPSGEVVFRNLTSYPGWCKTPMIKRLPSLNKDVPMTLIYGGDSYIDHCSKELLSETRPSSYIDVQVMPSCGHHVNADNFELFNEIVSNAAAKSDENSLTRESEKSDENEQTGNVQSVDAKDIQVNAS